jgi:MFS family permease
MSTPTASSLGNTGLIVLLAGLLLPGIDFSIVNVALGDLARTLHADETALELMTAAYGLAFAVCLALGGRIGDNFGRRAVFRLGVLLFGLASLGCGRAAFRKRAVSAPVISICAAPCC